MGIKELVNIAHQLLAAWPKGRLVQAIVRLREAYGAVQKENEELRQEVAQLKEKLDKEAIGKVNQEANRPSSKQPEWEEKGVGNDGKGKKKGKGRGRKPRKGAGNRRKTREPTRTETAEVEQCSLCGRDLSDEKPLETTNERIIEDIPGVPEETEIVRVQQEKKYCPDCQEVTTAKTDLALPGADIGRNATVLICYLWVAVCMPFPKMQEYLRVFFRLEMSTAGLSRHVIRAASILQEVYEEILRDVNVGVTLFADETGWRVRGKKWWLWVFGTQDAAYFTVDKSRGSQVVRRVLGEIFLGVLVVDGWSAYLSLTCEQQSCLAHLLRKIRKFCAAFPQLKDIARFYIKFRRIIRDGEKLQAQREELGELVFRRRLKRLEKRLAELLEWPDPDEVLQEIIKKVKRQQPRILTFVEHPEVPCHNNYGEFLIRIGVLKRKISGGSVSAEGAHAYAILLSIYVTCKLRKISFPKYMKASLAHYSKTGKPMSLAGYAESLKPAAKAA
jgi:transposase